MADKSNEVVLRLSPDEALVFYEYLSERIEADHKKIDGLRHMVVGEICGYLAFALGDCFDFPDDKAQEDRLQQAMKELAKRYG